ncbi:hypothetical protein [Streptomyces caelestis]|uniref:Uncharacterized protein n=1 Tax=Streptomyces caelestis TaxID=36816 RepID=A0A7W9LQV3_9ACTN|nr:hypothetical protein [Streptomyces caelestis]MBB5792761.1 hypothetical protein [Streptomyces caelestis]GGW81753.1 hypothetical protein GCM10010320_74540 [Streptomyces caelestis]
MPTDHACQSAAESAAQALDSLRPFLQPGSPRGADGFDDWATGAAALLVVLAGLQADRSGELTLWHVRIGDQFHEALGLPVAGAEGLRPVLRSRGWDALAAVQHKARELLTDLAGDGRPDRPVELSRQLDLVEDACAGALRRMAVPPEAAVRCAAAFAEAAGSLFGLHPAPPPRYTPPPPAAAQATASPLPPDWTTCILF